MSANRPRVITVTPNLWKVEARARQLQNHARRLESERIHNRLMRSIDRLLIAIIALEDRPDRIDDIGPRLGVLITQG